MNTDIKMALSIMHIPERADLLEQVLTRLDGQIADETLGLGIVRDQWHAGPWPTARTAWEACPPEATHHLLLQDDCLPCPDFLPVARELIALDPCVPLALALTDAAIAQQAQHSGTRWIRACYAVHTLAVALPVGMIAPFLQWCEAHIPANFPHDDLRLGYYLFCQACPAWVTALSLVEHVGRSTLRHGRQPCAAPWRESARQIDWSVGRDHPIIAKDRPGYMKRIYIP